MDAPRQPTQDSVPERALRLIDWAQQLVRPGPQPCISTHMFSDSRRTQARLKRLYLDSLSLDLATLSQALLEGHLTLARQLVHRIRGAALLTGDRATAETMQALQQACGLATGLPPRASH